MMKNSSWIGRLSGLTVAASKNRTTKVNPGMTTHATRICQSVGVGPFQAATIREQNCGCVYRTRSIFVSVTVELTEFRLLSFKHQGRL